MVFFQHLYYLRVPFLVGRSADFVAHGPGCSEIPQALTALLCEQNVRWVRLGAGLPSSLGARVSGSRRPRQAASGVFGRYLNIHRVPNLSGKDTRACNYP